jgi:nitrile hydratase beta subunit
MQGIHDLGGRHGFGVLEVEKDEPAFHHRWEAAVFAMMFAAGRAGVTGNSDRFRHAIERIDPAAYLEDTYYGRWLGGLETLFVEAGVLTREAVDEKAQSLGAPADGRVASRPQAAPDPIEGYDAPGCRRPLTVPPRFALGEVVQTTVAVRAGHTRLPAYARGRPGRITAQHGGWVFPDTHAHGAGEQPAHLYTVAFEGQALWGPGSEPGVVVHLDLFEPYLLPRKEAP